MLTGKIHIVLLIISLYLTGCSIVEPKDETQQLEEAWWVSNEFNATKSYIYGIPVSEINSEWKLASILDEKYYESILTEAQYKKLQESALVFFAEASFDGEPDIETFFVGVYESYSGERGRFIAIKRNSEIIKYFTNPGLSGYSSIYLEDNQLRWYKCMECSDYDLVQWTGSDYILQ